MKRIIQQCLLLSVLFSGNIVSRATTYSVGTLTDLNAKISTAVAGDTIILSNGVYNSSSTISVTRTGTAANPIIIRAETIGGAEITGSRGFSLSSPAAYVTVYGFKFTHTNNISISSGTSHCRFTRNIIQLSIPATNDISYINISGDDVEIDHNELRNKSTLGEMLDISGSGSQVARRLWVHQNYFHDFSSPGGNGAETIRWGLSGLSLSSGNGLCEYNLFKKCEGENELISNKSSKNTYRYNTFRDSVGGEMSQRHGNDCLYYGNYFTNSQGMRVYGDRHQIFCNYFENCNIGISMGNGDGDVYNGAALTAHDRPDDNQVMYNTFIGNGTHYEMGGRTGGLGSSNTIVADNIFLNGGSMASISSSAPYTGTWTNNIRWNTSSAGNMPASGYSTVNPLLSRDSSGAMHIQSGSPAINAGRSAYDVYGFFQVFTNVTIDMDGQTRDANRDTGADEFSATPLIAHFLSTNEVGPFSGLSNILATAPSAQTVAPGNAAVFTVTFQGATTTSTNRFTAGNLPANTTANFNPTVLTNTGTSTLTVTTTAGTPLGSYVLIVSGIDSVSTNINLVTLIVSTNTLAAPGTLFWFAGAGADKTWSAALNWTNVTSGGTGIPGAQNDVVFTNLGSVGTILLTNNVIDATYAGLGGVIKSLQYANTNTAYHTTIIAPGQTLMISNNVTGKALLAGTASDNGSNATASVTAAITGPNSGLNILAPNGYFSVGQGGGTSGGTPTGGQVATLDLSGLGTVSATVSNLYVGATAGAGGVTRACGVLYLAATNSFTLLGTTNALIIGDNGNGNGSGQASGICLGRQNSIAADMIIIGRQKATNGAFMVFNQAYTNGGAQALIHGNSNARVSLYAVGDDSLLSTTQASVGTNDFTGGSVSLLADLMVIGRSATGNSGAGNGLLTVVDGTIDVNTVEVGYESISTSPAYGTINLNGIGATLLANSSLRLARINGGVAAGTLNLNGGTLVASSVTAGGGTSTININAGVLILTNTAGTATAPLSTLTLTNATLHLNISAVSTTNIVVNSLSSAGVNVVSIDSAFGVTNTTVFPLISYAAFSGPVTNNFVPGDLPDGISGGLVNDTTNKLIELVLTPTSQAIPHVVSINLSGPTLSLQGTNGTPYGTYTVLTSTNVALPLEQWDVLSGGAFDPAGNFNFTNTVDLSHTPQFFLLKTP